MDALKKSLAIILAVIASFGLITVVAEADASSDIDGILIQEVSSQEPKGFALHNYGTSAVDIKGYSVADYPGNSSSSEGSVTISTSLVLKPGMTVVIASSITDSPFTARENVYTYSEVGVTSTKFNPAAGGDDIFLYDSNGKLLDAFCYGTKTISDSAAWVGEPVARGSGMYYLRTGTTDTDSAADWKSYTPGRTYLDFDPEEKFDANVTPFLFPESGGIPIFDALEKATESVYINMYQLTNRNMYGLLYQLEGRGVEVTILLEGEPLGSTLKTDAPYIQALIDAGGEVRCIGVGDGKDRYEYDHAKYAIIDMETVIVTSENWSQANLNGSVDKEPYRGSNDGNRGWGAIVESQSYAEFMYDVFAADYSMDYGDVKEFTELYPGTVPAQNLTYSSPTESYETITTSAKVTPVFSSDNSYEALGYYIGIAKERIYTEQQSYGASYLEDLESPSPIKMIADKTSSVDCKVIFGNGFESSTELVDRINRTTNILAAQVTIPYVHNKGVVCDDYVWVSSVNWTNNSFNNNRECCVVIESSEIADFFAESFLLDFYAYFSFDGIRAVISEIQDSYVGGTEITFTVDMTPSASDYTFVWDLGDGSEPISTKIPRIACKPAFDGKEVTYTLSVTATNSSGQSVTTSKNYTLTPDEGTDVTEIIHNYGYILLIIVIVLGLVIKVLTGKGKSKKTTTKKKTNTKKKKR